MSDPNPFSSRSNANSSSPYSESYYHSEALIQVKKELATTVANAEAAEKIIEDQRLAVEKIKDDQITAEKKVQKEDNYFSTWRDPSSIQRSGYMRFAHSIKNSFQTPTKTSTANLGVNMMGVGGVAMSVATFNGVAATVAASAAIAGSMGTAALILGVIALGYAIYTLHTNRDGDHEALTDYVWTLLDDREPIKKIWKTSYSSHIGAFGDAATLDQQHTVLKAAIGLLKTADSQYKLMGDKLKEATEGYKNFLVEYETLAEKLIITDVIVNEFKSNASKETYSKELKDALALIVQLTEKWTAAEKEGGKIFEYMRRLIHVGNYLQCAALVDYLTMFKMNQASIDHCVLTIKTPPHLTDLLARFYNTEQIRNSFLETSIKFNLKMEEMKRLQ